MNWFNSGRFPPKPCWYGTPRPALHHPFAAILGISALQLGAGLAWPLEGLVAMAPKKTPKVSVPSKQWSCSELKDGHDALLSIKQEPEDDLATKIKERHREPLCNIRCWGLENWIELMLQNDSHVVSMSLDCQMWPYECKPTTKPHGSPSPITTSRWGVREGAGKNEVCGFQDCFLAYFGFSMIKPTNQEQF